MKPIWIVDDDRSIRWVLEKALARENLPCKAFGVAQEVLNELEHDSPQVLISDIRMPGMSGIELLRAVKRRHPALPVIVMTAYSDLESAVSAFQAEGASTRSAGARRVRSAPMRRSRSAEPDSQAHSPASTTRLHGRNPVSTRNWRAHSQYTIAAMPTNDHPIAAGRCRELMRPRPPAGAQSRNGSS